MISHKHRCVYVHIPKTAGKSIKSLFGIPEFGHDYMNELDWIEDPYDHHPIRKYQGREWFSDYLKFTVVRNPWDRVLSAFFYLEGGGSNQFDKAFRDEKLARYNGDFEGFVSDLPLFANEKFFRPATYWLSSATGDRMLVDYVLRFERLVHNIKVLTQILGIGMPKLEQLNKTIHPDYRDCYSDRAREIVREVYAADISQFGYEF